METLITTRMILRGLTPEDDEALAAITAAAGSGQKLPVDSWALEHRLHHRVIGVISLGDDAFRRGGTRCRMLSVTLAEEFRGCGYAPEAVKALLKHAFHTLRLDIVTANHAVENIRFKRMLEACGFSYEGTLRRALTLRNGEARDCVCWSIQREEFEKLPVTRTAPGSARRGPR